MHLTKNLTLIIFNFLSQTESKKFKILSIDGGGIRDLPSTEVLKYVEEKTGKRIATSFNMITGTSAGALIGTMLNIKGRKGKPKYSAKYVAKWFKNKGKEFFVLSNGTTKYSGPSKRQLIKSVFGDELKITDLATDTLIPAYDTIEGKQYFFNSVSGKSNKKSNYKLIDVLDSTSSAPSAFPPVYVKGYDANPQYGERNFVDGGLGIISPVMLAITHAVKNYNVKLEDIVVLSIGIGFGNIGKSKDVVNSWGAKEWGATIPDYLLSSKVVADNFVAKELLGDSSLRVNFMVEPSSKFDNVTDSNLNYLVNLGKKMVDDNKSSLDAFCKYLA